MVGSQDITHAGMAFHFPVAVRPRSFSSNGSKQYLLRLQELVDRAFYDALSRQFDATWLCPQVNGFAPATPIVRNGQRLYNDRES